MEAAVPAGGTCIIHTLKVDLSKPVFDRRIVDSLLSEADKARAARFAFERDGLAWSAGRIFLRWSLAPWTSAGSPREVPIDTPLGKKPGPVEWNSSRLHFSISRSRGIVLVATTLDGACGVDVEHLEPRSDRRGLERQVFGPRARLPGPDQGKEEIVRRFTLKEAVGKALGSGVGADLQSIDQPDPAPAMQITPLQEEQVDGVRTWVAWWRPTRCHVAAVAVRSAVPFRLVVPPLITSDQLAERLRQSLSGTSPDLRS